MVKDKLQMVFTPDEINRLTISDANDVIHIIVDVHGMKCSQAKKFINNIINVVHSTFKLIVVHGYNHGTAIKNMLANNFMNPNINDQYQDPHNHGVTHISIA